jgi:hypothetical protein
MKKSLAVAGLAVFALIAMDSGQVITGPGGLVIKRGQAVAAELPPPPPPPAPVVGKGKAPIIGKGKAPAPVVTSRY